MSPVAFDDACGLLLAANLVTPGRVQFPNEPFEQPTDGLWMSVDCYSDVLDPVDIGANVWQERGRFIVYCFAPSNTGTADLRTLAKNVANAFRNLGPRNPFYESASIGMGDRNTENSFYCLPVSISFCFQDHS